MRVFACQLMFAAGLCLSTAATAELMERADPFIATRNLMRTMFLIVGALLLPATAQAAAPSHAHLTCTNGKGTWEVSLDEQKGAAQVLTLPANKIESGIETSFTPAFVKLDYSPDPSDGIDMYWTIDRRTLLLTMYLGVDKVKPLAPFGTAQCRILKPVSPKF